MSNKKYKIMRNRFMYNTDETGKQIKLYRIKACRNINKFNIKKGAIGGFVESSNNLSQYGDCWIAGDAKVYGNASIQDNVYVNNLAKISGNTIILGNCVVDDHVVISGKSVINGSVNITQYARLHDVTMDSTGIICADAHIENVYICGHFVVGPDTHIKSVYDFITFNDLSGIAISAARTSSGDVAIYKLVLDPSIKDSRFAPWVVGYNTFNEAMKCIDDDSDDVPDLYIKIHDLIKSYFNI